MGVAPARSGRPGPPQQLQLALTALAVVLLSAILTVVIAGDVFSGSSTPAGTGSGVAGTQVRTLPGFTRVDLAGDNNVTMRVGGSQSVTVHADTNLLGKVTTVVRSGTLVIDNSPGRLAAKVPMFVDVTVPTLDAIALHGSGNLTAGGIDAGSLTIDLSGSGTIQAAGTAARLSVTVGGTGSVFLSQLAARDAKAVLPGDGTITLDATRSLDARVSGTGTIIYVGEPAQLTRVVTGSGTIQPG